jgi:hypothetical protein
MTEESNDADSDSFLLDDDSRWKFCYDKQTTYNLIRSFNVSDWKWSKIHPLRQVIVLWSVWDTTNCFTTNFDSIPFSIDDISSSMEEKDFVGIKPAEELLENPAFVFLH